MHRFLRNSRTIGRSGITFKSSILASLGLGLTVGTIYWSTHVAENVTRYRDAYQNIADLLEHRKWKHQIKGRMKVLSSSSSLLENECENEQQDQEQEGKDTKKKNQHLLESLIKNTKSQEAVTIIDASNPEKAIAYLLDKKTSTLNKQENLQKENEVVSCESLGKLSTLNWPELLEPTEFDQQDDVYISIGVRRAFGENTPMHKMGFTHAVVLVQVDDEAQTASLLNSKNNSKGSYSSSSWFSSSSKYSSNNNNNNNNNNTESNTKDCKKQFAIFGYNAGKLTGLKPHFFLNDMNNTGVTRYFTFYNELTIKGKRRDAVKFFERMEEISDKPYKVFTCNCFSPIFTAMIEAGSEAEFGGGGGEENNNGKNSSFRFQVPEYFTSSLCLVVPSEQNYSFGINSNKEIKPYAELASAGVNVALKRRLVEKQFQVLKRQQEEMKAGDKK